MIPLAHQFLLDLAKAPPNGIYSDYFTRQYRLSFKEARKELSQLVDYGWITLEDTSSKAKEEFRVKITLLGQQVLEEYNNRKSN